VSQDCITAIEAARPVVIDRRRQPAGASLDAYLREGGYRASMRSGSARFRERIIDSIEASTLSGKGGATFPTSRKLHLMRAQAATRKYVVINGSEHEPGSVKDRLVLEHYPHKVIEGSLLLALAVDATDIVFAINETLTDAIVALREALRQAQSSDAVDFSGIELSVQPIPNVYIVGEETALLEVLKDRAPLPQRKPPFPAERGLEGFPTLVQNVETAAHVPFIVSSGAAAYRELGLNGRGVTLCTLGPEFVNSGVFEIPLGTPLREIVYGWGGGLRGGTPIKAIQPGGPSSGFLSRAQLDLPLDAEVLKAHGSALGCGVIKAFGMNDCMVRAMGSIMAFFAEACCGQCPRCRMETGMLDTILKQLLGGRGSWKLLDQVGKLINLARGEGICTLINMPVEPITTGMELFRDELTAHVEGVCALCAAHDTG
jgi:NADH:ubiquinone oxidoreductase subunit F (NADH-binding)